MMNEKTDILSLTYEELKCFLEEMGEPGFRAKQIFHWMHGSRAGGFDEMTNVPKALRDKLKETCEYRRVVKQEALEELQKTCEQTRTMFGLSEDELTVTWRDIATPEKATGEEVEDNGAAE